ncbi:hypothetical protein CCAX7_30040 [Capsulimonas corticalis]|uniref:Uncharacterized protein n=1 Tax=Capsulimonas corticalis TaxID=2219043 RepID=A0A402CSW6_9BACT|nr:beta-propeller fold lactonase family protein [Capsulimonas corticalis]BDI30953.1 hypothetical protein CCAX7_30040 [Capsulimonas corticalis]
MQGAPFLLAAILALSPMIAFADASVPVSLMANLERPACPAGQPVTLALALHNNGAVPLIVGYSAFEESSFQITVTDNAGRSVPRTAFGDRVLTSPMAVSANWAISLDSGKSLLYRFNLARLFDLSRAGIYQVSVQRRISGWEAPLVGDHSQPAPAALSAGPLTVQVIESKDARSDSEAYTPPPSHQTFLYMAGGEDYARKISAVCRFRVGQDGAVSSTLASNALAGDGARAIVATSDGRFLYVGNGDDNTISQFRIGDDGALSPLSPTTVAAQKFPGRLLVDPHGRFLYALSNWGNTLYSIGHDGQLTETSRVKNTSLAIDKDVMLSDFAAISPDGAFLYACNGQTFGYRLGPDGRVAEALAPPGSAAGPSGGRDQAIALSPSGRFAFILTSKSYEMNADGSSPDDLIVPMRIDAHGRLTQLPGAQTPRGPMPAQPGYAPCTSLAVDPSGRFLTAISQSALYCYRIGTDGSLKSLGRTAYETPITSVFFGAGHLAYVISQNSSALKAFRLDERKGLVPAPLDVPTAVPAANDVAAAVSPTPQHWGAETDGLTIAARLPADVLGADSPVVLTVVLKNVTDHPIPLGADLPPFRLALTGPRPWFIDTFRNKREPATIPAALLAAGHDLFAPSAHAAPILLPPGGQRQYRFVLSRLADLTIAGDYSVQVQRLLPSGALANSPMIPFQIDGPYGAVGRGNPRQELDIF